jgi:hypothetical protein
MAGQFKITKETDSKCVDCGVKFEVGEDAIYLARGKYAHSHACTEAQREAQARGQKAFWQKAIAQPEASVEPWAAPLEPTRALTTGADNELVQVTVTRAMAKFLEENGFLAQERR